MTSGFVKGTRSKTHKNRKNFTTKKSSKYHQKNGHYLMNMYKPFNFHKGSVSKSRKGEKAFMTHKGSKVYHRKGKYVRKNPLPYMMGG
jgi:hypothetical protein